MNSDQINDSTTVLPWYKQFWPWMLIALPGSVVIACVITIIISIRYSDDLVVGDYYKSGLSINTEIEKQRVATKYNISALFNIDKERFDSGILHCKLLSDHELKSKFLTVYFRHTINAENDRVVILNRSDKTRLYEAPFFKLGKGSYLLTIESSDKKWQLIHRLQKIELLEGLTIKS